MNAIKKKWVVAGSVLLFFLFGPHLVLGQTTDNLYTEIDADGSVIDGNLADIPYDKPVIRPTYMGKNIMEDVTGPDGPFKGFYDETPNGWAEGYYGHEYRIGTNTILRNLGTYKGKEIALKMDFTRRIGSWTAKVNLERDGSVRFDMDYESPVEIRLVYNDGKFKTPVENVYVELPLLYRPTSYNNHFKTYDTSYIKTSNLKRVYFTSLAYNNLTNQVSREIHRFQDTSAKPYKVEALKIVHDNSTSIGMLHEKVGMTLFFDNSEPLVFYGKGVSSPASYATFFKSELKTPGEIKYLPPRSKAVQNTDKFEAQFDLTQALNDGFLQYFPDYLSVVMSDREGNFNKLNLGSVSFTDQVGKDISEAVEVVPIDDHELEFRVQKADLVKFGSNQLNILLSADGLNSQAVMTDFDEEEGVYRVPVTFYNYKWQNQQKIISDELDAVANIIPNIYGEAVSGIEASQYTTSGDLEAEMLIKNVATTFPNDAITVEMIDPTIKFNEVKTYTVDIRIKSQTTNKEKIVHVPVAVTKAVIVTSDYLENQEWLINEINRQLGPKEIDKDLYLSDLLKITQISDTDLTVKYTGQHIPKTIAALRNLEYLELIGKELIGSLPNEIGKLTKLTLLGLGINKIEGEIPESLGDLSQLETLSLFANKFRGEVPRSLERLAKLKKLTLANNELVGQILLFPVGQLDSYNVSFTQLTFNDNKPPDFITQPSYYGMTLIVKNHDNPEPGYREWRLNGKASLPVIVDQTIIKPFDPSNSGYFDLNLQSTTTADKKKLFKGHVFRIVSQKSGEVVFEGQADQDLELVVDVGESFEIVMDGASKNPNNVFVMKGTLRDLSIIGTPKSLSLKLKTDSFHPQPVELTSQEGLKIRDNRLDSNWQLKVRPSELTSQEHVLKGGYLYGREGSQPIEIPVGVYKEVEKGKSNPHAAFIDVTGDWNQGRGLLYQAFISNYKGEYQGQLDWQIVDAPGIETEDKF